MHELALAEAIMVTALNVAEERGLGQVLGIDVRIGELQSISPQSMKDCLGVVMPRDEPRLEKAVVTFEIEPARFDCRGCGRRFGMKDVGSTDETAREAIHFLPELAHAFLGCPDCGSADFDVSEGRGVHVASIEGR